MSNLFSNLTRKSIPMLMMIAALLLSALTFTTASAATRGAHSRSHRAPSAPSDATFAVNNTSDAEDQTPGDGVCETSAGNGSCTLRGAIQEANALYAAHGGTYTLLLQAATYSLDRQGSNEDEDKTGDLDIRANLIIQGQGASKTVIDAAGLNDRVFDIYGDTKISRLEVTHGSASIGAGIHVNSVTLTLVKTLISENPASSDEAGAYGGGIYNSFGTLVLKRSTVRNNLATNGGAGITNVAGQLIVNQSTIQDNVVTSGASAGHGGGLAIFGGNASVTRSTIAGNKTPVNGGGILFAGGTMDLLNSTVSGNTSTGYNGGGIYVGDGTMNIVNSTVTGNQTPGGSGGGIIMSDGGTLNLANTTIAFNTTCSNEWHCSSTGAGIAVENGTVTLKNTLVANNTNLNAGSPYADDCRGTLNSQDFNLILAPSTDCTIQGTTTHNRIGKDPKLGPLANNGGPTQTHALLPGSAAIDRGNNTASGCTDLNGASLNTDQRGKPRPVDGDGNGKARCDIGAYEYQP